MHNKKYRDAGNLCQHMLANNTSTMKLSYGPLRVFEFVSGKPQDLASTNNKTKKTNKTT